MLGNTYKIGIHTIKRFIDNSNLLTYNDEVHVFLNIEKFLKAMIHLHNVDYYIHETGGDEIAKTILNYGVYYHSIFQKLIPRSKVIMYYNNPFTKTLMKNHMFINSYRQGYRDFFHQNTYVEDIMEQGITYLNEFVKYTSSLYCVHSDDIESSLIPYIISHDERYKGNVKNIIISTDPYDLLNVSEDTILIRHAYKTTGCYTVNNVVDGVYSRNKCELSHTYLPFILGCIGDTHRDIPRLCNLTPYKTIKKCMEAINKRYTTYPGHHEMVSLNIVDGLTLDELERNMKCTSLSLQYGLINDIEKNLIVYKVIH